MVKLDNFKPCVEFRVSTQLTGAICHRLFQSPKPKIINTDEDTATDWIKQQLQTLNIQI